MRIHFSGIGGSGLSAIAGFIRGKGHDVSGSDRLFDACPDHDFKRRLEAKGIVIFPQDGTGINGSVDLAVFSTAVENTNPEFVRAASLGVPVMTRPEYLSEIVTQYRTVAIAGTSGKSTTSGMLAFLMQRLGMSPNFIGGGRVKQLNADGTAGNYCVGSSAYLVIEACESDGSIVNYKPEFTVLLNLDLDHHSVAETGGMFETLADNSTGRVLVNADDWNLRFCRIRDAVTFSIEKASDYQAVNIRQHDLSTDFEVYGQGFRLSAPGRHNLYNSLACISVLAELDVPMADIAEVLPEFTGIERRFDIHLHASGRLVIDDYAHNPHKIQSMMQTVQVLGERICYIFQPHGFGPTRLMKDGYIRTFVEGLRDRDMLIILPVYYAGGTASRDISSEDIAGPVRDAGKDASVRRREEIYGLVDGFDVIVTFGARDDSLSVLAEEIADKLGG